MNSTIMIMFLIIKNKMNKIIIKFLLIKFLLIEDKFLSELNLKQPGFTYSACGLFTKHSKNMLKFREKGNLKYLYRSKLEKACFAHDVAYSNSKDLATRAISDNILKVRAYEISSNCNHDGYQRTSASMVYKFFNTKIGSGISVHEQLTEELHNMQLKNSKGENSMRDLKAIFRQ